MRKMRDLLFARLKAALPDLKLNGHPELRLPNTLSVGFPGIKADMLLSRLEGVAASAGAACHIYGADVSSVLKAMKVPMEYAMGTVRFSVGKHTTAEEIGWAAEEIIREVLRQG
jgi:cysteine desulfurase